MGDVAVIDAPTQSESRCPMRKAGSFLQTHGKTLALVGLVLTGAALLFVPVDMFLPEEQPVVVSNAVRQQREHQRVKELFKMQVLEKATRVAAQAKLAEYKRQKAQIAKEMKRATQLIALQKEIQAEKALIAEAERQQVVDIRKEDTIAVMVKDQKTGDVRVVKMTKDEFRSVPIAYQEITDSNGKVHKVPITVGQYDDTKKCMSYWGATALTAVATGITGAVMNGHVDAADAALQANDIDHYAHHVHQHGYIQAIFFIFIGLLVVFFCFANITCYKCIKGNEAAVANAH